MSLGQNIKKLRKKRNVNQTDLSDFLKVAVSTISSYETDDCEPNIANLIKIAQYFQISVDYLLGLDIQETKYDLKSYLKLSELINLCKDMNDDQIDALVNVAKNFNKNTNEVSIEDEN